MPPLIRALAAALILATPASAKPASPVTSPAMGAVTFGIFCALQPMDRVPAPGTLSGWMHVPDGPLAFHWPDQNRVPATLGIAFGVQARSATGTIVDRAEVRVYRPGRTTPETWGATYTDTAPTISFFRFDTEAELIPGLWAFEAWQGGTRLYRVEFDIIPPDQAPGITQACGATA